MAYGIVNADTHNDSQGGILAPISSVMRNRIINGQMQIDQRNAGASVTPANNDYTLDRWQYFSSQASKFTIQQNAGSVTPPVGFTKYLGLTVASAVSIGATDYFEIAQSIEGFNIADLAWGTANAKTVTLSFQVYSSLTGTFGGAIGNSTGTRRSYPFTYTISSANTWTTISVTITGCTDGTWNTSNTAGIIVRFGLGVGSTYSTTAGSWASGVYDSATGATSVVGTNGATFYITGVQLEKGVSATGFEYRQYGQELALCQRYYYQSPSVGWINTTTNVYNGIYVSFPVFMRATPTITTYSTNTNASGKIYYQDGATDVNSSTGNSSISGVNLNVSNVSTNVGSNMYAKLTANSEL